MHLPLQSLMHLEDYVHALGALTGNMAMQQVCLHFTPSMLNRASCKLFCRGSVLTT